MSNKSDEKVRQKHKHYDLILAWAEGKEIQFRYYPEGDWRDVQYFSPSWDEKLEYRIKPEPKPDIVGYIGVELVDNAIHTSMVWDASKHLSLWDNKLKVIIDGETGKLKSAEVLDV